MHDYFLEDDQAFNAVPYEGDIQLIAFTSYTINQIKWKKATDTFEVNQSARPLLNQRDHCQFDTIYNRHATFLRIEGQDIGNSKMVHWVMCDTCGFLLG